MINISKIREFGLTEWFCDNEQFREFRKSIKLMNHSQIRENVEDEDFEAYSEDSIFVVWRENGWFVQLSESGEFHLDCCNFEIKSDSLDEIERLVWLYSLDMMGELESLDKVRQLGSLIS